MRSAKLRKMRSVASIKTSGGRFYVQRNRPEQGVEGGSLRPLTHTACGILRNSAYTHCRIANYAKVERNAKLGNEGERSTKYEM